MKELMQKYQKIPIQARASFWFLICSFLQKGISTITTPIFTRLLSTEEYGLFNSFNSWMGIITVFVCFNLYAGVYTQGLVKFEEDRKRFSSSLQGLNLFLISFWFVIYTVSKEFWNSLFDLTEVQIYAMFIMIWSTAVFRFWAAEKRVTYDYKSLVFVTIVISIAKPVLGIYLVRNAHDKVTARIIGLAIVELIGFSWMFFYQIIRGRKIVYMKYWIYALSFNIPLIPHYLSQIVLNNSDRLMIKSLVGVSEAGIYSLAYSISQIMLLFNQALIQTIEPWIYSKIKKGELQDISKTAYPAFIFIAGINLLLIIFAPEIVGIFAPKEYYDAIWVIPPVAMSVLFMFAYSFFACFEFYYEKTKFVMIASIIGALLNLALNRILLPIMGYYAAGYTTLLCYLVFAIGHYCFMNKICYEHLEGVKVYNTKLLVIIAGMFILLGVVFMITYNYAVIRYCFIGVIIVIVIIGYKKIIDLVKSFILIRTDKLL